MDPRVDGLDVHDDVGKRSVESPKWLGFVFGRHFFVFWNWIVVEMTDDVVFFSSEDCDGLKWDVCPDVWRVICVDGIWNDDVVLEVAVRKVEIPELEDLDEAKLVEWTSLGSRYLEERSPEACHEIARQLL